MLFRQLASYLEKLEKTSSRLEITRILADLFKETTSGEIDYVTYLVLGQLTPSYKGIILNLAEKMMIRVLAVSFKTEAESVMKEYKKAGDLGSVAFSLNGQSKLRNTNLMVSDVYQELLDVAEDSGEGSQERKINRMADILSKLDPLSAKFVARIPVGKLRLGFSDKTILDALSWMEKGDKSAKLMLERAYQVLPDVGLLAKKVKKDGIVKATEKVSPVVGVPVLPMLAQRLKSPDEMIDKMGKVAVEPKLDGLRLSIHFKRNPDGFTKAFTRNMNETSWMFPELGSIGSEINGCEVILDSEAVGLDEETKQMANFQTTMTRRRKHDIGATAAKTGIKFYVFDILFKDGQNLMDKSYIARRKLLEESIEQQKNIKLVDYEITDSPQKIESIYKEKISQGFEGVVVKKIDAKYIPGRTGFRWVKMKQVESAQSKLLDTVDCVVMGYTQGKGKRAGFGVGQFLVGVVEGERIKTVSKIGTGLTDDQFRELKKRLSKLEVNDKPKNYDVHKNYIPDFWVKPSLVVETAADEITKSPTHTSGLALRFPRLVKFRDDKSPKEATNLGELKRLFKLQKS